MSLRAAHRLGVAVALLICAWSLQANDFSAGGPQSIAVVDGSFTDAKRERVVPYRLYRPVQLHGRLPVVIYTHGNSGSRREAAYLGTHLASHGYLALHIQHPGSDEAIVEGLTDAADISSRMQAAAANPLNHAARYEDVPFVIDQLAHWNDSDPQLRGHVDLSAIGLSGHSWGALTTLIAAGARNGLDAPSYKDARIRAAIALSPSLPRAQPSELRRACAQIDIPMLHFTGTADSSPVVAGLTYERRIAVYDAISAHDQYLVVLEGADHMLFTGAPTALRAAQANDKALLDVVKSASLAFWDWQLRGDAAARRQLESGYAPPRLQAVRDFRKK